MNTVLVWAGLPAYLVHTSNPSVPNHFAASATAFAFVHACFLLVAAGHWTGPPSGGPREFPFRGLGMGFAQRSQARQSARPNRVYFVSCSSHVTLLRTGCSPRAALHPVLPRRSSLRFQAGERSTWQGLSPCCVHAFVGARAPASCRHF